MKYLSLIVLILLVSGIISSAPASFAVTLGEQWDTMNKSLQAAEKAESVEAALSSFQNAKTIYTNNFKNAAIELDKESDTLIETAFANIEQNLKSGKIIEGGLNRQIVDKTTYKIAYMKIGQALDEKNVQKLMDWFTVMEKKFKISEKESFVTNHALAEIQESSEEIDEYSDIIKEELLGLFKLKTIEELEEAVAALEEGKVDDARKFTYEGLYYYRTLHPSVIEKLGAETAEELLHEMEEAVKVTSSGVAIEEMKEELEHIMSEVELIIREYEGGDTSTIGRAISGIKDRLVLVDEEYSEAVKDGKIVDQVEYDETVVFLGKATEIFNENKNTFNSLSESDTTNLENHLNQMKTIVDSFGNTSQVSILVGKSLNIIASLEELAGGTVEISPLEYIDENEKLLNEVKTTYRNGDAETAFALASEAYLDNYEFVEAPLAELDGELMLKIETEMREELRNMIKAGASPDEIDAQVDMILADLEVARAVIPEFGTIAMMILAIGIGLIIVSLRNKKTILNFRNGF
ncbi:MAG: PEFG-CTERM sorting domain-containing protein [Candidatus Aenigmarchaeota archaeon]|nr:PEFG-CTERM sorting domain-containing protein [Candidatus Aenigmarchaeota archaeon]